MLQNSPSWATLLTFFKVIFLTWYLKKGINRRVDRFFWGDQNFSKYCFSPKILSEATIERLVEIAVLHLWWKTWKIPFKDVYVQILVLSLFENFPFFLYLWSSFLSNFCIFRQNSMLVYVKSGGPLNVFWKNFRATPRPPNPRSRFC